MFDTVEPVDPNGHTQDQRYRESTRVILDGVSVPLLNYSVTHIV